jgi:hypothetical protein
MATTSLIFSDFTPAFPYARLTSWMLGRTTQQFENNIPRSRDNGLPEREKEDT